MEVGHAEHDSRLVLEAVIGTTVGERKWAKHSFGIGD